MRDSEGFDMWSADYDADVLETDRRGEYPFAGYYDTLSRVYARVVKAPNPRVLDLGFGTAALTEKLYKSGAVITGVDFSEEMIKLAKAKMPNAAIIKADFSNGVPSALSGEKFDFAISTYAFHHVDYSRQPDLIRALSAIADKGVIIGDITFPTRADYDGCKAHGGDGFDREESYIIVDELRPLLSGYKIEYTRTSFCAGVLTITLGGI